MADLKVCPTADWRHGASEEAPYDEHEQRRKTNGAAEPAAAAPLIPGPWALGPGPWPLTSVSA